MKKINAQTAQELTTHYDAIADNAFDFLKPKLSPEDYLKALIEKEYFADSVIFLAHALPKREAIWWACICSKAVTNKDTTADDLASLTMAEKWVYEPDDKKRRMCGTLAEKVSTRAHKIGLLLLYFGQAEVLLKKMNLIWSQLLIYMLMPFLELF